MSGRCEWDSKYNKSITDSVKKTEGTGHTQWMLNFQVIQKTRVPHVAISEWGARYVIKDFSRV